MRITTPELYKVDIFKISQFEYIQFDRMHKTMKKEEALQVIINNIEGDWSQLSPELYQYAVKDTSWTQDV